MQIKRGAPVPLSDGQGHGVVVYHDFEDPSVFDRHGVDVNRHTSRPTAIRVSLGLVAIALVIVGLIAVVKLYQVHPPSAIGPCPSTALVIAPGSRQVETSQISVGGDAGCWAKFDTARSSGEVFDFYTDVANIPGWVVSNTIPSVGEVDLASQEHPGLKGLMLVGGRSSRGNAQFTLSVCLCDPHEFAQ